MAVYDAAIVGAGAAGLAALRELRRAGLRAVVVEALNRIGGRIYTVHDPLSAAALELGAEFVHGRPPQIFEWIDQARLAAIERAHQIHRLGQAEESRDDDDDGDGAMWQLMSAMEDAAENGPDRSFAEFAASADFGESAKRAATAFVEGFNAARAGVVSIRALAQESKASDEIEGGRAFHLVGGYDALAHALLPPGAELRLNTIVERIEWAAGRVKLRTRSALDGSIEQIEARRAMVTVSLGVLQSGAIEFAPEPREALDAARALAFGDAVRVTLRFERPPDFLRPGFLMSGEPLFPTWWTSLPAYAPIVTGWSAGPKADGLVGQPRGEVISQAIESLRRLVGSRLPRIQAAYFHDWRADGFFCGAYSYVPVGKLEARAKLAAPVESTLYFAGEASDVSGHGGTVHGAIEAGRRAGQQLAGVRAG